MSAAFRLRPWQEKALVRFEASASPDFLAVATPGAGKTAFALEAARRALAAGPARRVLVVTPTEHLKRQWAAAADGFGLALEPDWSSRGALPPDFHGAVVTWQQVASTRATLRRLARRAFVVLDEIHHAGDSRAWGDAIRDVCAEAPRRLALSGTPFRSDDAAIPFVRYEEGEAVPDFAYGYAEALAETGVVRPVFFPRINGEMEWTAPDGSVHRATFDDPLDRLRAGQRLRTALSLAGEWLPAVLARADARLRALRRLDPRAGGMVIAADQEHARGVAALLRAQAGVVPALALSDEPGSSARIHRFARGDAPWIVAVRMVSEGVDVPRLRVGVHATPTTTELFFRQAVGRLVRHTPDRPAQEAHYFVPDDPRLRLAAARVQQERRHALRPRDGDAAREADRPEGRALQASLFAPISAVALDEVRLDPPAPPAPLPSPRERREALRERNAALVRELVHRRRLAHAEVNAELNRRVGIRRITEASLEQLARRARAAEAWLRRR